MSQKRCFVETCQFANDSLELMEHEDHHYCEYHLPLAAKKEWTQEKLKDFDRKFHALLESSREENGVEIYDLSYLQIPAITMRLNFPTASKKKVLFNKAHFEKVDLRDLNWVTEFSFAGAHFHEAFTLSTANAAKLDFTGSVFHVDCNININNIRKEINFTKATFLSDFKLSWHENTGTLIFAESLFYKAPSFPSVGFSHSTSFRGANFLSSNKEDLTAYRRLRIAMHEIQSRDDESDFIVLEQRSLRKSYKLLSVERIASRIYDDTSEYGTSYWVSLRGLLISQVAFFFYYSIVAYKTSLICTLWADWGGFVRFTLAQVFRPFELFSYKYQMHSLFEGISPFLKSMLYLGSILHSSLSLTLFALFLLALRWRFKRE